jgi:hypothetical protein
VARAVSMRHTIVPPPERSGFHAQAGRAKSHYVSAGCHYWLFEESSLPGAFVEFFEAPDADTLMRAHRKAPGAALDNARLYVEVELS